MRCWFILAALAVLPAACDGSYAGFLNEVPVPANEDQALPIEVILGIDGLSRASFNGAKAQGAFATFHDADLIAVFPASSDYAWTRMLRASSLGGYEIEYFDAAENTLVNQGATGIVDEYLRTGLYDTLPCYQRFDFLGNGEDWMIQTYLDPEASLPGTLDELFYAVSERTRQQDHFFGFILNVDVLGHSKSLDHVVSALVYIDRRIQDFKANHEGRYTFTIFGDHGNTHRDTTEVDGAEILKDVGVKPVDSLGNGQALEAVPVSYVRVSYLAIHTHRSQIQEVAWRLSGDTRVDLAVANLEHATSGKPGRYAVYRRGLELTFSRTLDGQITIDAPEAWTSLGITLPTASGPVVISDAQALVLTAGAPYPDIFYRVATAFENPAATNKADIFISFPDDLVSGGYKVPVLGGSSTAKGFHGSLSAAPSHAVLASERRALPSVLRGDDVLQVMPELAPDNKP
jgi:hypothetical protein